MIRRGFLKRLGAVAGFGVFLRQGAASRAADSRPNILFAIADDWGWPFSPLYGDAVVKTPHFERVAREGVLFRNAYCVSPSCSPSRASILTGRMFWELEQGANLWGALPSKFDAYPDILERAGYYVGLKGKGWGPGSFEAGGRTRNPAGPVFGDFGKFLDSVPEGRPFCFWFGSSDPHRPYDPGSGLRSGKTPEAVYVPPFLPDAPEVRSDILDYYYEVERFDRDVGEMLHVLEGRGLLDRTLVVVTGDNGMPFPRCKTNLYDFGVRLPLAVRWGSEIPKGRTVDDFVSFADYAPTFLEAAGLRPTGDMSGRSFLRLLRSSAAGWIDPNRDCVFLGRERHVPTANQGTGGYPMRAIRTKDFLYIRNFMPERWPAGDPEAFVDVDGGPTKEYMLLHRGEASVAPLFERAFGRRPAEELYDLADDPYQMRNVAFEPKHGKVKEQISARLEAFLRKTGDPRMIGRGELFDRYPNYRPAGRATK